MMVAAFLTMQSLPCSNICPVQAKNYSLHYKLQFIHYNISQVSSLPHNIIQNIGTEKKKQNSTQQSKLNKVTSKIHLETFLGING
jgi:hypothetical protein